MVKAILQTAIFASLLIASTGVEAANGREEFEKGSRYFKAEEYEAALPYFQKAYELSGQRPAAVFALAQCERSLKMYESAIRHFREYLKSHPPNAVDVEETIALLNELLTQQRTEQKTALEAQQKAEAQRRAERAQREAEAKRKAEEAKRKAEARISREAEARRKAEAELQRLKLEARPQPSPALTTKTPEAAARDDRSMFESPWFWVITGAVAVGSAVTAGVLVAQSSSSPEPYAGTTGVILRP